jgi:pyruvate dehydrogenase E2 component (dihydrolipoamide acetyltransferase)
MAIELKMPALSPTMEEGTLAKWMVKVGDSVKSGDLLAEIETDKATMEFEAVDEGVVSEILVAEGAEGVKVGTVIALISGEGEEAAPKAAKTPSPPAGEGDSAKAERGEGDKGKPSTPALAPLAPLAAGESPVSGGDGPRPSPVRPGDERPETPARGEGRVVASPLAKRLAEQRGVALSTITGTGPGGRIVKADVEGATPGAAPVAKAAPAAPVPVAAPASAGATGVGDIPHEVVKLSGMRKTIARRLTESKQQVPHIYLTVDIRLDALLKLRGELNKALEPRAIKLSVNDMLIKALAAALIEVPACNVSFAGDTLIQYSRADISVAVSIDGGLITPIVADAATKSMSAISTEMKALADKAKAGKLQPHEYQGGTASLSNMGMFGIKQFEAVINPPQAMIMAIGAGEKRPYVVDDALAIATVMSATGSFDHRAIDGSDGAKLMAAFKRLVEMPLGLVA